MISARELLEQADALMRRGRAADDEDVPVLEDVVELGAVPAGSQPAVPVPAADTAAGVATPGVVAGARDAGLVEPVPGAVVDAGDTEATDPANGEAPERGAANATEPTAAEAAGFVAFAAPELPALQPIDAWIPGLAGPSSASPVEPPIVVQRGSYLTAGDSVHPAEPRPQARADLPGEPPWGELREQLLATVMQRLELLTDHAVSDQLAQRVRPVVERAGAELVATISREMRELVRGCVAEAIEREITAMRDGRMPPPRS